MYSVVVPVYKAQDMLPELHRRLKVVLESLGKPYEIIFVEDAGGDDSWTVIQRLAASDAHLRGLQLGMNFGQHNALLCGIRAAQYEIIITLDDDLQNPPEEIPKLLNGLTSEYDVVYGTPETEQHGLWRDVLSVSTKWALQKAMGAKTARKASPFRVFRTYLRDAFRKYDGPYVSIDVLLTWGTTRFAAITVDHKPSGSSGYTVRKLIAHAMNMMTGFSVIPLQLASLLGFAFTLFGGVVLLHVVIRYFLQGDPVPGFPFLASLIAIFSGAQMLCLGIIGEYLARMHFRTMNKPSYLVRGVIGGGQAGSSWMSKDKNLNESRDLS
jgi:undecaprenyl-phosphate 4-deoxy-4-formamido-L-arabinose transferase